jgi:O-antigen/teichoic acid export membrane protein
MSGSRIRNAVTWSAVENGGLALLSVLALILYARFLSPAEFGFFSMVLAVVEIGTLITTMFFHDALIQREHVDNDHYSAAFWSSMAASVLFVALCWLAGPLLEAAIDDPRAGLVLLLTSLAVPAATMSAVAMARLRRDLDLKPLAVRSLIGRLTGAVVGIGMVIGGAGIWALVAQQVLVPLIGSVLLWGHARPRYRLRFEATRLRELAAFGVPAITSQFLTYSIKRVFVLFSGTYLGAQTAGYLNLAFRVTDVLWSLFSVAIGQVVLPALARLQQSPHEVRSAFKKAAELTTLPVGLCFGLMAALAPEIVQIMFGAKWSGAVPLMIVLSTVVLLQAVRLLISAQLIAGGRPGLNAFAGAIELGVIVLSFVLFEPATAGIVMALWIAREGVVAVIVTSLLHRQRVVTAWAQWGPALPAALGVLAMCLSATVLRTWILPGTLAAWIQAAILGFAAVALFVVAVLLVDRQLPGRLTAMVRQRPN